MGQFKKHLHPLISRSKQGYNDPNNAILKAIEDTLNDVELDTIDSKIQSSLKTATGEFLDEWGGWFGVFRHEGESDTPYRRRIVRYINIPRGTNHSIKEAVRRYLRVPNAGVEIYEPFRNIFFLNSSKLNGEDKLMGDYHRFAVIQVNIGEPFDDDLLNYMYRFVPAGVRVHVSYDPSIPREGVTMDDSSSLFSLNVKPSQLHVTSYSGLVGRIGGTLQMGDNDNVLESFVTNNSSLNSEDVLTGSFTHDREMYHILGIGRGITPKIDSRMNDIYTLVEDFSVEEYKYLHEGLESNEGVSMGLSRANEAYQVWNIDKYIHSKYYGSDVQIKRTRESYAELFSNSAITIKTKVEERGKNYRLEIYNFETKNWDTLISELGTGSYVTSHGNIEDARPYMNENRLLITRINTNDDLNVELDYVGLDYRKRIDNM